MIKDDDIRRVEIHDIAFATPHICRICGGRITGSYLAEIHTGGVVTFRCLSHTAGLGMTVHEGKLGLAEEEGQMAQRRRPAAPTAQPTPATSPVAPVSPLTGTSSSANLTNQASAAQ